MSILHGVVQRRFALVFSALLLALISLAACNPDNPLADTNWRATYILNAQDELVPVVSGGNDVTLNFDRRRVGGLDGSSGCNTYFSDYTVKGAAFDAGAIAVTEMACTDDAVMALERDYLSRLDAANSYQLKGEGELILLVDGATALVFAPR
ncbi:MAG: META domain-containing protein [Caldilineales bacterium]|nr:META domain-containing protein [Caldilineales bacterium]